MTDAKFILAGTLLTSASEPVLRDRLIRIRGDVVESVEPLPPAPPETSTGALVIDARDKVVMPGLINAHCHHTEVLQRSLRDRVPFELWLPERRGIEDALDLGYDDLLAANHIALLENLKHGAATVLHHLSRRGAVDLQEIRACIEAADRIGIRTFIAPSVADVGWRRVVPAQEASAAALQELDRLGQALDLVADGPATVKGVVAPSSPHTCTDDFLGRCLAMAEDRGLLMHTHFLETRVEATQRTAGGETTVDRASRLGLLRPETSLAHAVHLTDRELDLLKDKQPAVVHNPCSNAKLGSGIARIREMLDRGITVALGSDGGDTSDGYSIFDQMKMAALMRRPSEPDFNGWITATESLAMATIGAAKALGLRTGRIAPGHLADVCILKPGTRMWPAADLAQALVYSENGSSVDTVLVGGNVVLENGESPHIDEAVLGRQARELAERVERARSERAARKLAPEIAERLQAAEHEYREAAPMPRK
ncbi:MAG: amidohydrolase family protein [Deltaproteobacteria bacterium]|nr:amidohydrolase family protein [Deltaproteobacteria bacterium]